MAPRTQFKANQVSGFNADYYLGKNPDVGSNFDDWAGQQPMDFAHYVKNHSDLENVWRTTVQEPAYGKYPAETRWSWGEKHWNKYGQGEDRAMAYDLGDNHYIMSKGLANDQSAENAYGAWHFDTSGRNEGRYGTHDAWFNSPGEVTKRNDAAAAALKIANDARDEKDRLHDEKLEKERAAALQKAAEGAEYGRLASMRGGGSQTLGASGAATFKGKGLKSSENKRGKGRGTGQFKRPYGTSNLSIAATGKGNQQSTLNL